MKEKKKLNVFEIVAVIVILFVLALLIIPSVKSIARKREKDEFSLSIMSIYNTALDQRSKDTEKLESNSYQVVLANKKMVEYNVKFDEEDNMTYLCVSNGAYVFEFESEKILSDNITNDKVKRDISSCIKRNDEEAKEHEK